MERDTKQDPARSAWRAAWRAVRRGVYPVATVPAAAVDAARDALDARRDGVDASWPGARGRLLAGGWRPLPPPVLP